MVLPGPGTPIVAKPLPTTQTLQPQYGQGTPVNAATPAPPVQPAIQPSAPAPTPAPGINPGAVASALQGGNAAPQAHGGAPRGGSGLLAGLLAAYDRQHGQGAPQQQGMPQHAMGGMRGNFAANEPHGMTGFQPFGQSGGFGDIMRQAMARQGG